MSPAEVGPFVAKVRKNMYTRLNKLYLVGNYWVCTVPIGYWVIIQILNYLHIGRLNLGFWFWVEIICVFLSSNQN